MRILLYRRPGCPLCDEAEELLDGAGVTYERRNILEDAALFERYRYRVPVVNLNGADVLELKFSATQLHAVLASAGSKT